MRTAVALALFAASSTAPVATSATKARSMTHAITHYDLDVPEAYSLRDVSPPTSDFALYDVESKSSGARLRLYFGNHPRFPQLKWDRAPLITSSENKTVQDFPYSAQSRQLEGLLAFTGLRFRNLPLTPYSSVHYFASDVSEEDGKAFTAIARSIRVARAALP